MKSFYSSPMLRSIIDIHDFLLSRINATSPEHGFELIISNPKFAQEQRIFRDIPYRYSLGSQNYYCSYYFPEIKEGFLYNCILVLKFKSEVIGFTPLTFSFAQNSMTSNGSSILLPYIVPPFEALFQKHMLSNFLTTLTNLSSQFNFVEPTFQEYESIIQPEYALNLEKHFSEVEVREVFYKNCLGTREELWKRIRKSYKPLINKGLRELDYGIARGPESHEIFVKFRELHREVAGRVTRSPESWAQQESEFLENGSFLAYIKQGSNLLGAALICYSKSSALYAVGVYRRELQALNLGHLSLWLAIQELNQLKIEHFRIGDNSLNKDPLATKKLDGIAHFKSGFADRVTLEKSFSFNPFLQ